MFEVNIFLKLINKNKIILSYRWKKLKVYLFKVDNYKENYFVVYYRKINWY